MRLSNFLTKALNKGVELIESISKDNAAACDKGDCLINNNTLYHTCSESSCPRINEAKAVSRDGVIDPCLWPYMKQIEKIQSEKEKNLEKCADLVYDLAQEYMPKFVLYLDIIGLNFIHSGISRENLLFSLLWELKDADISWTCHQLEQLVAGQIGSTKLHLQYDFYRNPSLYDRDGVDFDYTVKAFESIADPEQRANYYVEDAEIDISEFCDEYGNIKPAGVGGAEKGFDGDTIWNVVVSWEKFEK